MIRFDGFSHLLTYLAEQVPEDTAFFYEEGGEKKQIAFRGFRDLALARAEALKEENRTCAGIFCDGTLQTVTDIFGSVLAGLQTVLLDANASDEALTEMIRAADVDLLLGEEELTEEFADAMTEGLTKEEARNAAGRILFFTSGTTERAKAVVLTDRSLMSSAYNGGCKLPLDKEDILLCNLPLHHVFGFVCSLLWGMSSGAKVALGRGPRHYADDFAFYQPTVVSLVPMLLGFLMKYKAFNKELKTVLVGAGDCPAVLLGAAAQMGIRISFGYGLTETSSGVAISISGDPYALEICPDDTISLLEDGEILIEAPTCMMQGYYKRPEETAKVLVNGVLHTGDLGYFDAEGKLHITGRKKEMLVLADGTKIFLPEYEAKIRSVLPEADFAVIEADACPVLVLKGEKEQRAEVQEKLKPVMAAYPRGQQIREILFVRQPLPRTASGKVKRWEIRKMLGGA